MTVSWLMGQWHLVSCEPTVAHLTLEEVWCQHSFRHFQGNRRYSFPKGQMDVRIFLLMSS